MTRTEDLYLGARRTAVEKIDREIEVAEANMNLGIDNGDWPLAMLGESALRRLRAIRDQVITCHHHEIEEVTSHARVTP